MNNLVQALKNMTDYELVELVSQVLPYRDPYKSDPSIKSSKMFLGVFAQDEEGIEIMAVAYPKEIGPDWGFCQHADSEAKGISYISNCKVCISPFTGEEIHLT